MRFRPVSAPGHCSKKITRQPLVNTGITSWIASVILSVTLVLGVIQKAQAGAWAQPPGKGLAVMTYNFYYTENEFSQSWQRERIPNDGSFMKNQLNLYVEYGLIPNVSFIGNFFFDFLSSTNSGQTLTNAGFADQETGFLWQFSAQPVAQSFVFLVHWPAYSMKNQPNLGNGYASLDFRYYVGDSFELGKTTGFWEMGVGYWQRFGPLSDFVRWWSTVGVDITRKLRLNVHLSGAVGLQNGETQFVGDNILLTTNYSLIKIEPSLIYKLGGGWSIQGGPTIDLFGQTTGAGGGGKLSVWKEF